MSASTDTRSHIEHVKLFLKWNLDRFIDLDSSPKEIAGSFGWRRPNWKKPEFWIKKEVWPYIFDDGDRGIEAAKTLHEAGLLRVRNKENFFADELIYGEARSVYAIMESIIDWVAPKPIQPIPLSSTDTPLSELLSGASRLSLIRAIELLSLQPDPSDQRHASLLKAQVSLTNTMLTSISRAGSLQSARQDDMIIRNLITEAKDASIAVSKS